MEIRRLAALQAVLEAGSFTAAARRQHLSQPALWAQVKALEADLGLTLFARAGRGVAPTAACLALRSRVRGVLDDLSSLLAAAKEVREGRAAPARIGCAASHVSYFLADCLQLAARAHPEAPFPVIVSVSSATGLASLERGDIDLLVEPWKSGSRPAGCALYELWVAAVGPLVKGPTLPFRKLAGQPLATYPADTGLRMQLDQAARAAGIALDIVYEARDASSLVALAARDLCTSILTSEALGREHRASARLTFEGRPFDSHLWLRWMNEAGLSPAARILRDVMRAEAERRRRRR
jgi:DNA-binding transcriptional LysR family regulator